MQNGNAGRKKLTQKVFLILLCAAIPVWLSNFFFTDWAGAIGIVANFMFIAFLWKISLAKSSNLSLSVFTGGFLMGQGLIPLVVSLIVFMITPVLLIERFPIISAIMALTSPGYEFFLQLEQRLALDAVTYTTWYTALRAFLSPFITGSLYGVVCLVVFRTWEILKKKRSSIY